MKSPVAVAVALIRRKDGCLLLGQRPASGSYPLKWEFPGGKLEPGETSQSALVRELREELGIEAAIGGLYHEQVAHYADNGTFSVCYFLVDNWQGEIANRAFADLRWVPQTELIDFDILEGNRDICTKLARSHHSVPDNREE
jgi:8-oxo-dGTP diphosphatase